LKEVSENDISIDPGDAIIIANGYGVNHKQANYLSASPSFEPALVDWLIEKEPGLLGVDTPIMENPEQPFQPVIKLFEANSEMLLLAPLNIDTATIKTGTYYLSCAPLKVENVSGMLCRPLLIDQI
jgi:kynurenine formamidase